MPSHLKRQNFGPSCSAGNWYSCENSKFVGCCESNPCTNGCPQDNIRPAGFDSTYKGKFPDASCGVDSNFYTCDYPNGGTFWGCCKSDPCQQEQCPTGDLVPAFLDRPEQSAAYSPTGVPSATFLASRSASSSIALTTTISTITPVALEANAQPEKKGLPIPLIAGSAGGGAVALIIIGLLIYYILHARKSRKEHIEQIETRLADLPASKGGEKPNGPRSPSEGLGPASYNSPKSSQQLQNEHPHALSPASSVGRKPITNRSPHLSELSGETVRGPEPESPWHPPKSRSPQSSRETWGAPISQQHPQHPQHRIYSVRGSPNPVAASKNHQEMWGTGHHQVSPQMDRQAWEYQNTWNGATSQPSPQRIQNEWGSINPQSSQQWNQNEWKSTNPQSSPLRNPGGWNSSTPQSQHHNQYYQQEAPHAHRPPERSQEPWTSPYSQFAPASSPRRTQRSLSNPQDRDRDTWEYSNVPPQQPRDTLGPEHPQQSSHNHLPDAWPLPRSHPQSPLPRPETGWESTSPHVVPGPHSPPRSPESNRMHAQSPPQSSPTVRMVEEPKGTRHPWRSDRGSGHEPLAPQESGAYGHEREKESPGNKPKESSSTWI
ncbi:uncharacterized protein BDR25DRAFT_339263 [Lindgomyces ingoldianus]|uniref:Uncharacterized protein n=1 Tax=Lindgomyces ingoldianus TaxID=673940 RepID=A0ACB6RG68_9PLEO|nr:uncharacterized protein BDR25DRAFT_339263 [Lindgomyces ingoldianus]KAF2477320.1 hypothetical protein BDR25DRAFT_339263 [Lindgomyces ingoldianus]